MLKRALPIGLFVLALGAQAQSLEIHYINVGQGGATLIIGPEGRTIMYDFGKIAGKERIVPYLQKLPHIGKQRRIDYAIISHADTDHYTGYADVVNPDKGGFDITTANLEPGTDKRKGLFKSRALDPAVKHTTAKAFKAAPVGFPIALGGGARGLIVAANGKVWGEKPVDTDAKKGQPRVNENDRSISLFIEFGKFRYIIDGDLGAGGETCTNRITNQRSVQPRVARQLLAHGLISSERGVDVLHLAHHGSESSTSSEYYNLMKPRVALVSVGPNQGSFRHPRRAVVENVLTCPTADGRFSPDACKTKDTRPTCVTAPPVEGLFQTDNGDPKGCAESDPHCVSFLGLAGGDIVLKTDGKTGYTVTVNGNLMRPDNRANVTKSGSWTYDFDWPKKTGR